MENTTRTMRELRSVAQMVKRSFHWIFLMKIQFYHVTWVQKNFFIAIFEKNRSKYIGLNRLNIGKLTKENQAFCTCPSLTICIFDIVRPTGPIWRLLDGFDPYLTSDDFLWPDWTSNNFELQFPTKFWVETYVYLM